MPKAGKFSLRSGFLIGLALLAAVLAGTQAWILLKPKLSFADPDVPFEVETLVSGLEHPWGMALLPQGGALISERAGRLRWADADWNLRPEPVAGLPEISPGGQGGLLDVALHPDFDQEPWVYIAYVAGEGDQVGTEVARGRWVNDRLEDAEVIFRLLPKSATRHHFGSRLAFDPEGYLYITLGDRGERDRAQDLNDHAGSVIRLYADGRLPEDNPFADREGTRPEIYSYGHRNIQGAAVHPETGALWIHEHGPQGGDEINIIRPGRNYGWPEVTYGAEYGTGLPIGDTEQPGMEQPLYYWDPSIAPSGMAFYRGDEFPEWRGDLLAGALKYQLLARLVLQGEEVAEEERYLQGVLGRIRAVRVGRDGAIYLLTDAASGELVRLTQGG